MISNITEKSTTKFKSKSNYFFLKSQHTIHIKDKNFEIKVLTIFLIVS